MKCINCGRKLRKQDKFCSECGINQNNVEIINEPKKNSNKIFIIVMILLTIISLGISISIIVISNNKKNTEKESKEIVIDEEKELLFKNYKFKLLDNYKSIKSESISYIKSKEYIILYDEYPLGYKDIINNKEILINELEKQGYSKIYFDYKTKDEDKYIIVKAILNDIDYGFIFYEIDSDTNMFVTITANELSNFNDKWFDEVLNFLNTKEKV